jgi:uncharacterized membrane protein
MNLSRLVIGLLLFSILIIGSLCGTNSTPANANSQQDIDKMKQLPRRFSDLKRRQLKTVIDNPQQSQQLVAQSGRDIKSARERWNNLTPEQKDRLRKRYKWWKSLSPEKKAKIRERYRQMSPEQRRRLREKLKRWQNLSPERKKQLREQYRKRHRKQ